MRLEEAKRDYYRKQAKEQGYRSRAAFKLQQMNNKYHFMRRGSKVLDLGCAPGGWLQVSSNLVGNVGQVIGVDLVPVKSVAKNTIIIQDDIASTTMINKIADAMRGDKADIVLADLSPKLSGIWDMDHYKQIDLCFNVMDILPSVLKIGGSSVMKAFQGGELTELVKMMKISFSRVDISKPNASRKESSEVYLVGLDFTGLVQRQHLEERTASHPSATHSDSDESDWQGSPES
jgi:23S rRNA (uridine2552-2'-O)-methyltransferase